MELCLFTPVEDLALYSKKVKFKLELEFEVQNKK